MSRRSFLTKTQVDNLKPAPAGKRIDHWESATPGFGVRVTETGAKSFILVARFPGASNPTRRAIGDARKMSLASARAKAKAWHELIADGKDPAEEERKAQAAEAREKASTFGSVVEEYIEERVKGQRRGEKVEREIRRHLLPEWRGKPVATIARTDVATLVKSVGRKSGLYQAHNVFGHVRTFFNWAIASGTYGLEISPCDRLEASALAGGSKKARQRVLGDDELGAYCRAADRRLGYPFGPMFKLLVLTGQRRDEVSGARWREIHPELVRLLRECAAKVSASGIDWSQVPSAWKLWTVPAERFKGERAHVVTLSDDACAVLAELPFFAKGDHLFSTTFGKVPVSGFSKAKDRLDRYILRTLKALARTRGEDAGGIELAGYVIHDVRRTVRTRLSSLKVQDHVAELVIGHGRKGIAGTYDVYSYLDEKRDALDRWAAALRAIVAPPPANVIELKARVS